MDKETETPKSPKRTYKRRATKFEMTPDQVIEEMIRNGLIKMDGDTTEEKHCKSPRLSKIFGEKLPTPKEIKAELDKHVIGQDEAKRILSVAVYNHYKRIRNNDTEIEKSNIMLCGPTGSGKTLMIKTIAKMLGVPCYIGNATSITASGYVGDDVENLLVGLLRESNWDLEAAKYGMVFIDEIDKTAKKGQNVSITRDVSGECVQQSLLKMVEGNLVGVPPHDGRKFPGEEQYYLDTTNILFVVSGAFVGIDDIVRHRLGESKIGFDTIKKDTVKVDENYMDYIAPQDLRDFGMIPEFVGRFPIITNVNTLTEDDMKRILTEPENSITYQYISLFRMDGVKLTFEKEAIDEIAHIATSLKTGARGLKNIVESVLVDYMFDIPEKELTITPDIVREKLSKKCRYKLAVS